MIFLQRLLYEKGFRSIEKAIDIRLQSISMEERVPVQLVITTNNMSAALGAARYTPRQFVSTVLVSGFAKSVLYRILMVVQSGENTQSQHGKFCRTSVW